LLQIARSESAAKKSKTDAEPVTPLLFSYFRSTCSWRVRLALNLKQLPFDIKPIHLLKGEDYSAEYTAVNPMKSVPALVIDGHTLAESRAIIEYLEETRPEPALMPEDAYLRAKVRQLSDIITSDIQPIQNLHVLEKAGGDDQAKRKEWAQYWIRNGFEGFEAVLATTAGKYCVGDQITVADLCLVPQVYNARRSVFVF
jgi:maleylacetoacetate isomerase